MDGEWMEIVFNELSALGAYQSPRDAQQGMHRLVQVARSIVRHGADRTIRTTSDFMERYLAPEYRVANWLNDKTVDLEERRFVKAVTGKAPHLEDCFKIEENKREEIIEFFFGKETALGLGVAFLWDAPAVSLDGDGRFASDTAPILLRMLGEDGDLKEEMVEACCLSTLDQVARREPWIRKRVQGEVRTGAELWKRRQSLLSSLVFCADAVEQVQKLTGSESYFRQILRHLFELDRYVADWLSGPFSLAGVSWSEESGETLRHPEYGPMRRFLCPNGFERTFSLHTKPTGGNVRIHFFPLRVKRIAYVAYIGPHLPTVRHNG
jgi:hypothetical protein